MGKEYYQKHKERLNVKMKEWRQNNPDYDKEYKIRNKDKVKKYMVTTIYTYKKLKYDTDINYKLRENIRVRIWNALKGKNKTSSSISLLGCSIKEYKLHLESQFKPEMNWNNHGKIWEIDHVKSCSKFDLNDPDQQKQCFHYSNTQPLFKTTKIALECGYIEEGNRNKLNKYNDK